MTFGLRIRDAAGNIRLDTGDRVGRIVHRSVLPANTNGTVSVPGYNATNSIVFATRLGSPGVNFLSEQTGAHVASYSSPGTITYTRFPTDAGQYATSLLLVIAFGDQ